MNEKVWQQDITQTTVQPSIIMLHNNDKME